VKKSISPATAVVVILIVVVVIAALGYFILGKGGVRSSDPGGGEEPDVLDEGGTPEVSSGAGGEIEGIEPMESGAPQ